MTQETPQSQPENRERILYFRRDVLRREALSHLRNISPEDSDAYEHAVIAVESFLKRTLDAANLIEIELKKNESLSNDDERRLSIDEVRRYEDFLTQAEALAIILPRVLQQTRIVQYHPDIQKNLIDVFTIIHDREALIRKMETARAAVLLGSERKGVPFTDSQIEEITSLATTAWMVREKLSLRPELTEAQKAGLLGLVGDLKIAESAYQKKTETVGEEISAAGKKADTERKRLGTERITQGFPGATLILDSPALSIDIWRRLLKEGGAPERMRAARQLRKGVLQFEEDFLRLKAYEDFENEAKDALEKNIQKNNNISHWFDAFHIPGKTRVLTNPEEFQKIFDEVIAKVKGDFNTIASSEDARNVDALLKTLSSIEKGKTVDETTLEPLLTSYTALQEQAGEILASLQRWQVLENADRVGGTEKPTMLDQVTRIGDKTFWSSINNLAPYGIFRTRSYRDDDGRIILLAPANGESLGWQYQFKEGGKAYLALEAAIISPLLHRLALRIPVLGPRLFGNFFAKHIVPIASAEVAMAGAKKGADLVSLRNAVTAMEQSIERLKSSPPLNKQSAKNEANDLFQHLLMALQAAEGSTMPDQELALESHIYTNQLLMALGYPPYHEIASEAVMANSQSLSPEIQEYLTVRENDHRGINTEIRMQLQELQSTIEQRRKVEVSPVTTLLSDNEIPALRTKQEILTLLTEALHDPKFLDEFHPLFLNKLGASDQVRTKEAYSQAGHVYLTLKKLRAIEADAKRRMGKKYEGRNSIDINSDISMGQHRFSLASTEKLVSDIQNQYSALDILTIARFLETHEPTNEEIARFWYQEQYPPSLLSRIFGAKSKVDAEISMRFGKPGNRKGLGEKYLREWVDLWDYKRLMNENSSRR